MEPHVRWTRVVVEVPAAQAELAADRLWAFGPAAVEVQDGATTTVLAAGYDDPSVAARAAAAIGEASGPAAVRLEAVVDDGLDGWRAWATVERAGPFTLVPTWLDAPEPAPGELQIRLDPGRTFGSGSHPTTRLVLGRLPDLVVPGGSVLDVGTGSGVLAVGAALLGGDPVLGIDVDLAAPEVGGANAARNGVADRVQVAGTALAEVVAGGRTFALVLANLLAPVVVELAADLVAVVAPGGALVVSGLLDDRWAEATAHLAGLAVVDMATDEGWAAITLRPGQG